MSDVRRCLLLAGLVVACGCGGTAPEGPAANGAPAAPPAFTSPRDIAAPTDPVRVRLPSIGVDAPVTPLGRLPDGTVDVPREWQTVGWFAEGPRPGDAGPAVLLGHVDSVQGPAVFYRLRELRPGDVVQVSTADGQVAPFSVTRVAQYPKDAFPTDEVYLPTLQREVRLVTCGGIFDRGTGHYRDNVIVFAEAST